MLRKHCQSRYLSSQEMYVPRIQMLTYCISKAKQNPQCAPCSTNVKQTQSLPNIKLMSSESFLLIPTVLFDIFYTFAPVYISCEEMVRFAQQFKDFITPLYLIKHNPPTLVSQPVLYWLSPKPWLYSFSRFPHYAHNLDSLNKKNGMSATPLN